MDTSIQHNTGGIARQIQAGKPESVRLAFFRPLYLAVRYVCPVTFNDLFKGCFKPGSKHKFQCPAILDFHPGMGHTEILQSQILSAHG